MASGSSRPAFGSRLLKGPKDLLAGLMFMAIGALGLVVGWDYPKGSPVRLGTGVFPAILSWGLVIIGALVFVEGLLVRGPAMGKWAWRPVLLVGVAASLFAVLIEPAGLVISMVVLMGFGALAGDDHTWREFSIFTTIMVVMAVCIFIWGLGMPIKVFPWS